MAPNPGFVFVSCTGPDHKGDKKLMPKLRQHVMLHHLRTKHTQRRKGSSATPSAGQQPTSNEDVEEDLAPFKPFAEHATQLIKQSNSRSFRNDSFASQEETLAVIPLDSEDAASPLGVSFDPFDALPVKGIADIGDIFQWFYSGQINPGSQEWRNSARYHWLDKHWDLTRQSPAMFNFTLCFALEKKGLITRSSQASRIFQYRSHILAAVQADLARNASQLPGQTVATIGGLAYIALRDGETEIAKAHVKAISLLAPLDRYEMHIWLYVVWTDLRLAASTFSIPLFKYYIPVEACGPLPFTTSELNHIDDLARRNMRSFPSISDTSSQAAQSLFQKLHQVCIAVDKKDIELTTLYGHLYDSEYSLIAITHAAWKGTSPAQTVVKIILLAAQLAFWMSTFYVLPQGRRFNIDLHSRLLEQMALLTSHPSLATTSGKRVDLTTVWESEASLDSLQWVLFIAAASSMEFDHARMPDFIKILKRSSAAIGIKNREDFEAVLKGFPWTEHGCGRMSPLVWAQIRGERVLRNVDPPQQMFWIEEMAVR
ncbi:Hypothetical protein D9617_29g007250 [Elsinoe fawcettii]|nr:Hypothetical protein D9617_29g007250 [Elsinoe fawcettii]